MKRIMILILACVLTISALVACTPEKEDKDIEVGGEIVDKEDNEDKEEEEEDKEEGKEEDKEDKEEDKSKPESKPEAKPEPKPEPKPEDEEEKEEATKIELKEIHSAIKEEFGEDYIPNMELGLVEMENLIGLTEEDMEDYIGEMPMISINVDTFIGIKAKDGKANEVESALKEYRRVLVEESMQYPMNLAKVTSSKVVRHGDYVFFLMIGKYDDREEASEEERLEFAEEQTKRAEDVIDGFFK